MKRILLFLLFTLSFPAFSQVRIPTEYSIQNPLQLQTVNPGSKADSVLVRGSDKIVKFVPRSEFGGEPKVPSLLDVTKAGANTNIPVTFYSQNFNGFTYVSGDDVSFVDNNTLANFKVDGKGLSKTSGMYGNVSLNVDRTTQGDINYNLDPNKAAGDYTIATLDDIPSGNNTSFQSMFNTNNEYTTIKGGQETFFQGVVEVTPYTVALRGRMPTVTAGIEFNTIANISETDPYVYGALKWNNNNSKSISILPNVNYTNDTNLYLPFTDGTDKTLATTDDFKTINGQSIIGVGNIPIPVPTLNDIVDNGGRALTGGRYITSTWENFFSSFYAGQFEVKDGNNVSLFKPTRIEWYNPTSRFTTSFSGFNGGGANFNLPNKGSGSQQTLTTEDSFKTINGESIIGSGDITIGGGGSQTLDQVLATGETAIDKRIFFSASDSNSIAYMNQYGFSNTDNVGKRGSINYLQMQIEDNDNYTSTSIIPEGINIARRYGNITVSSLEDITGTFTQTLQSKSGIIATTDDITLQKVLDNGRLWESETGIVSLGSSLEPAGIIMVVGSLDLGSKIDLRPTGINLNTIDTSTQTSLTFNAEPIVGKALIFKTPTTNLPDEDHTLAIRSDIKLKSYTVSTLPDGTIGDQAYVTDATAPTYLGILTGGGSVVCPVFYNGTTWVSH